MFGERGQMRAWPWGANWGGYDTIRYEMLFKRALESQHESA